MNNAHINNIKYYIIIISLEMLRNNKNFNKMLNNNRHQVKKWKLNQIHLLLLIIYIVIMERIVNVLIVLRNHKKKPQKMRTISKNNNRKILVVVMDLTEDA